MKFIATFKTPDAARYALEDVPSEEMDAASQVVDKFVEFTEYVRIEFDTETQEARVIPVNE